MKHIDRFIPVRQPTHEAHKPKDKSFEAFKSVSHESKSFFMGSLSHSHDGLGQMESKESSDQNTADFPSMTPEVPSHREFELQGNFMMRSKTPPENENSTVATTATLKNPVTDITSLMNPSYNNSLIPDFHLSNISKITKQTLNKKAIYYKCEKNVGCPGLLDDFYTSPLDLGRNGYALIALQNQIAMYRQKDGDIHYFSEKKGRSVLTCVKYNTTQDLVFSGETNGGLQVHDAVKRKTVRLIRDHNMRVGCLEIDQKEDGFLVFSGSKDYMIHLNDIREKNSLKCRYKGSNSEVCGLTVQGNFMASGCNDGSVRIWDLRKNALIHTFNEFMSATKAISWCPWKTHSLTVGGGKGDSKLVVFNTDNLTIKKQIKVKHPISGFDWRVETKELLYAYGNSKKGVIKSICWSESSEESVKVMSSHNARVLGFRVDPRNSDHLCSVAADACLRYWNLGSQGVKLQANEVMNADFKIE